MKNEVFKTSAAVANRSGVYAKIGELLDYGKLSDIHPLKLPEIEKKDVPNFIKCSKYEKAQINLKQKMERYVNKVNRCIDALQDSHQNIEAMKQRRNELDPGTGFWVDREDAQAVARYNDRLDQMRKMTDKIGYAIEKHNDLVDKRAEAEEEAKEKLEELTNEALAVIDEDIAMAINRIEGIVNDLTGSEDAEDLVAAIDICSIALRIHAMFEGFIDDSNARKECKEGIAKVNQTFSTICTKKSLQNYMIDIYRRNLDLVQKNAGIYQQIVGVLGSVDQKQLDTLTQSIDVVLAEKLDTIFDYSNVIDPAEIEKIVDKIKETIESLKLNIEKAKALQTTEKPAVVLGKTGTDADQQANSMRALMQSNFDALNCPLTQNHFAVQIIDEDVIDDFYQKDLREAVTALRNHIVNAIGEANFEGVLKGGDDRFSLKKAQNAIDKANLTRLQATLNKIPHYISELIEQIKSAESDIQKANEVPKRNADALNAELNSKYNFAWFPILGLFSVIGIQSKVKTFEPAFRSTNQIYKDLGNVLLEKNMKTNKIILIIGAILGFGGIAVFLGLNLGIAFPVILLALYVIAFLVLKSVEKRLRSFLQQ